MTRTPDDKEQKDETEALVHAANAPIAGPRQHFPRWLTEGVALTLLPALAYAMAYTYEVEYARAMRIPSDLIQISWDSIISTLLIIASAGAAILFPFSAFIVAATSTSTLFFTYIALCISFLLWMSMLTVVTWPFVSGMDLFFVYITILILLFFVIIPFWIGSESVRLTRPLRRIAAFYARLRSKDTSSIPILRSLGAFGLIIILYATLALATSHQSGFASSLRQEDFILIEQSPKLVVIRSYGRILICREYNMGRGEDMLVSGPITVINLDVQSPVILNKIRIPR